MINILNTVQMTHAGPVTPLSNKTSVKNSDIKSTYA